MANYKDKNRPRQRSESESDLREQIERADRQIDQMVESFAKMQRGYERRKVGKVRQIKPLYLQEMDTTCREGD